MAPKISLTFAKKDQGEPAENPAPAQAYDKGKSPEYRRDLRPMSTWVDKEAYKLLREIAAHEERTLQDVVAEAVNLMLKSRGKPPVAEVKKESD